MRNYEFFPLIVLALGFSLLLHFSFYLSALLLPDTFLQHRYQPLEITLKEKDHSSQRTFVTDPDLGMIEKKLKEKAQWLSKYNRRVKEEMMTRQNDRFQQQQQQQQMQNQKHLDLRPKTKIFSPSDFKSPSDFNQEKSGIENKPENQQKNSSEFNKNLTAMKNLNLQASTQGEFIPHVKEGEFTALNTDQFLYYSFFARINEQVRYRWVSALNIFADSLSRTDLARVASTPRISVIEVLLKPDGYLKDILLLKSSGEPELDRAAVQAFKKASPFLNPPAEMVKEDQLIHLVYSFHVEWQSPYNY